MISKKEILLSTRLRRTRRILRRNIDRRGTSDPFLETILMENHVLERKEWLR
jgi:hypothetical protein